jgi:tetratricopeptide (TPR) repeat protein
MTPARRRRLLWTLPVGAYAIFFWRSPYALMHLSLGILDWVLPTVGLGLWVLMRRIRKQPWPATPLDRPTMAWLVVTALTALFSINVRGSLRATWGTLIGVLILYLLVDATQRGWGSALWRSLYLLAGVVFLMGILELASWYFGLPLVPNIDTGWLPLGGLEDPFPPTLHRLTLALINATPLSGFVALVTPPILCTLPATKDREMRVGLLLWLVAAGVTLFFTFSRGGFLALGASVAVIGLGGIGSPQFRRWWRRLPHGTGRILLAIGVIGTLAATIGVGYLLMARLTSHRTGDMARLDMWRSAWEMFRDHSLTGVGPTAYGTALRDYRTPLLARDQINEAHSLYLEVAAEMGLPGLAAGAWLSLTVVWVWWRRWRSETAGSPAWWRVLGIGAALVGLLARSFVDVFVDSALILPTLLFIAYLLAPQAEERPTPSKKWKWTAAAILLALSALALTWETWAYALFNRGVVATRRGEVEAALSAVERARRVDPWMPLYNCHAGYLQGLQAAAGNQDALTLAFDQYQACAQDLPTGWVDQLNHAALLWQAGHQAEALNAAAEATAETPTEETLWLNRGYWAEMADQREEAIRSYGWMLSLDPRLASSPFWEQGGRPAMWDDILAAGAEALVSQGESENEQTRWRWRATLAREEWNTVLPQIERRISTHPRDAAAMAWLGETLLVLGQPQDALSWLERAIEANPGRAHSYTVHGEAALALEHYEAAEESFRIALFIESHSRAHLGLARVYRATGHTDQALVEYANATQPPTVLHTYELVLYRRAGWSPLLPQVIQIRQRDHCEAALEWGALLEQEGEPERAQDVYQMALGVDRFCDEIRSRIDP